MGSIKIDVKGVAETIKEMEVVRSEDGKDCLSLFWIIASHMLREQKEDERALLMSRYVEMVQEHYNEALNYLVDNGMHVTEFFEDKININTIAE